MGVAVLVNGQIEEVNVYPNHELLAKFYPRLIQSYALQATLLKDAPQAAEPIAAEDVARFVSEGSEKNKEEKKLVAGNSLEVCQMESDKFRCTTHYEGKVVHWQMLKKNGAAADQQPRCAALGNNW